LSYTRIIDLTNLSLNSLPTPDLKYFSLFLASFLFFTSSV